MTGRRNSRRSNDGCQASNARAEHGRVPLDGDLELHDVQSGLKSLLAEVETYFMRAMRRKATKDADLSAAALSTGTVIPLSMWEDGSRGRQNATVARHVWDSACWSQDEDLVDGDELEEVPRDTCLSIMTCSTRALPSPRAKYKHVTIERAMSHHSFASEGWKEERMLKGPVCKEFISKDMEAIIHGATTTSRRSQYMDAGVQADVALAMQSGSHTGAEDRWPRLHWVLEHLVHITVILNCVLLGASLDNQRDSLWWSVMHGLFLLVFIAEQIERMHRQGKDYVVGPKWRWNAFEGGLVLAELAEFILSLVLADEYGAAQAALRALRVARVARWGTLVEAAHMKEMVQIMRGTWAGLRYLFWASVLMSVPLYAAAVFYRDTLGDLVHTGDPAGADMFPTVPMSFYTVFSCAVAHECFDEQGRPIFHLIAHHHHWFHVLLMCVLTMFMEVGLMNVIHALFVEQVLEDAEHARTQVERQMLTDTKFFAAKTAELLRIIYDRYLASIGEGGDDDEWWEKAMSIKYPIDLVQEVCSGRRAADLLTDLSVAEEDIRCLGKVMDIDGDGTIEAVELLETLASMRGAVGRSDVINLTFKVEQLCQYLLDGKDIHRDHSK